MTDKRRFTRVPFDAEVVLHQGGNAWPSDLIDISFKGMLVVAPAEFVVEIGSACLVDLILNEEVSIEVECTLVHRNAERVGLRIDRADMESMAHLRRLLELNLGDPDLMDRELGGLSG